MHLTLVRRIIGIDCATQAVRVGLACARWEGSRLIMERLQAGREDLSIPHTIAAWLQPLVPTLLALDAPLGWPEELGTALVEHTAGGVLPVSPDALFNRATDRFVWQRLGKRPLEVGADRIARTAYQALALLQELRRLTGLPIPLAWDGSLEVPLSAIEVYPAATLKARHSIFTAYKKARQVAARQAILAHLQAEIIWECSPALALADADCLDAALCVLAGADFLSGKALPPQNSAQARKEGWIWFREA